MLRHYFILPALAMLWGCTALPTPSRIPDAALDIPPGWATTRAGQAGIDTAWIGKLGDPTLTSLVREALHRNPDMKVAEAQVRQSRSQVKAVAGTALPQLDLATRGSRAKRNFIGFPIGGNTAPASDPASAPAPAEEVLSSETSTFDLNFQFQWELDVWGRIRAGTAAAAAASAATSYDLQAAQASLAAQVARSWFTLREAHLQTSLAADALKLYQDTEQALRDRFRAGQAIDQGGLGAQLRLARSDISTGRAALTQRRESEGLAARALESLIGRYPHGTITAAPSLPELTSPPPPGLPADLLCRRPDILAAERRFAAQGMRRKEARRAIFPRFTLTGSRGTSTDALAQILNSDFGVWSVGAGLAQSILTGGRVLAEIDKRGGEEQEALARLQKTVLRAFGEVEDALAAAPLLAQRERALQDALQLATDADKEARANFRTGNGDILTILSTQTRALSSRSQLATLRRLQLENRIALHLALGGDFDVRKTTPPNKL